MAHIRQSVLPFVIIIILVVVTLFLSSKISSAADTSAPTTRLSEEQVTQIARIFCRKIGQTITVPGTATFTKASEINPGIYWQSRWEVEFSGQAQVEVVDATGIIAHYSNESYYTMHRDDGDSTGEAITQQEAIQHAKKAIDATGQSEPIKFESAQILQGHNPPLTISNFWFLEWHRMSNRIPYRDQYAHVMMDAQTGEIRDLVLKFTTPPLISAVQAVSQDGDMNAAASVIITQGIMESATHTDTHLEIIQPGPDQKTTRLAWISTFVVDGHWRQVYLDAETGDVLGGGRDNGPAGRGPVAVSVQAPVPIAQALKTAHTVYLRRKEPGATAILKPFLKFGLSDQPHKVAVLKQITGFSGPAPSETASEELVMVSKSHTIGVYSYYPEAGLLGNGSDWVTVANEFKEWIRRKGAVGVDKDSSK